MKKNTRLQFLTHRASVLCMLLFATSFDAMVNASAAVPKTAPTAQPRPSFATSAKTAMNNAGAAAKSAANAAAAKVSKITGYNSKAGKDGNREAVLMVPESTQPEATTAAQPQPQGGWNFATAAKGAGSSVAKMTGYNPNARAAKPKTSKDLGDDAGVTNEGKMPEPSAAAPAVDTSGWNLRTLAKGATKNTRYSLAKITDYQNDTENPVNRNMNLNPIRRTFGYNEKVIASPSKGWNFTSVKDKFKKNLQEQIADNQNPGEAKYSLGELNTTTKLLTGDKGNRSWGIIRSKKEDTQSGIIVTTDASGNTTEQIKIDGKIVKNPTQEDIIKATNAARGVQLPKTTAKPRQENLLKVINETENLNDLSAEDRSSKLSGSPDASSVDLKQQSYKTIAYNMPGTLYRTMTDGQSVATGRIRSTNIANVTRTAVNTLAATPGAVYRTAVAPIRVAGGLAVGVGSDIGNNLIVRPAKAAGSAAKSAATDSFNFVAGGGIKRTAKRIVYASPRSLSAKKAPNKPANATDDQLVNTEAPEDTPTNDENSNNPPASSPTGTPDAAARDAAARKLNNFARIIKTRTNKPALTTDNQRVNTEGPETTTLLETADTSAAPKTPTNAAANAVAASNSGNLPKEAFYEFNG